MTEEAADPVTVLSPLAGLKVAAFWLGALSLLATVTLVAQPATGAAATVVSVLAMAFAVVGSPTWRERRIWPHVIAVALAAVSTFGLCATKCGTYAFYDSFLGLETGIIAIVLHGIIAFALFVQIRRFSEHEIIGDIAVAIGIGGSLFFATILVVSGTWCGACFAIHALMAVQCIELFANRRGIQRYAVIATVIAAAGLANATYHHRPVPEVRDDPAQLLAYMRGLWTADAPPQRVVPISEQAADASRNAISVMQQLGSSPDLSSPMQARALTNPPSQSGPVPPLSTPVTSPSAESARLGSRAIADANRWGKREAPIALAVGIDLGCPVCAQQFSQVLELKDLVDAGKIQVRFLMSYKNDASQASASLAYAAGMVGEQQLLDTLTSLYAHQADIITAADAVQHLPPSFPSPLAIASIRLHKNDISELMTDASKLKETLGSTGDPMLWYFVRGGNKPSREFKGLTLSNLLRLAANSLE